MPLVARVGSVGLATLLSKLLTLAALGIAARALGPKNWGLAGSALAAVAYASVLLSPGLLAWGTREIARDRQATRATLLIVNLTQTLLACGAYLAVAAFARHGVADPAARAVLLVSALALFAQALSVDWVFDGLERPQVPSWVQVAVSAARLAAVIALCRSPSDILAYAAIVPFFLGVQALAGYLLLYRGGCCRWMWPGLAEARRALTAAWPLGLTMALFVLAHNANTLVVEIVGGSEQAGHYLAALRFVEMASVLPGVVGAVFRPRLARLFAAGSPGAARETRLYARAHLLAGLLLAPLVFAEAPRIIVWLYGEAYAPAIPLLRIFTLAILANYLVCGYTNCLVAFGRDRVMLRSMAVAAAAAIAAGLILTPRWGPPGAAFAASLIHPVGWLVALPAYRRTVGPLAWRQWRRPLAAAAAIVALSLWLEKQGAPTLGRVAAATTLYLAIAARSWIELEQAIRRRGEKEQELGPARENTADKAGRSGAKLRCAANRPLAGFPVTNGDAPPTADGSPAAKPCQRSNPRQPPIRQSRFRPRPCAASARRLTPAALFPGLMRLPGITQGADATPSLDTAKGPDTTRLRVRPPASRHNDANTPPTCRRVAAPPGPALALSPGSAQPRRRRTAVRPELRRVQPRRIAPRASATSARRAPRPRPTHAAASFSAAPLAAGAPGRPRSPGRPVAADHLRSRRF